MPAVSRERSRPPSHPTATEQSDRAIKVLYLRELLTVSRKSPNPSSPRSQAVMIAAVRPAYGTEHPSLQLADEPANCFDCHGRRLPMAAPESRDSGTSLAE